MSRVPRHLMTSLNLGAIFRQLAEDVGEEHVEEPSLVGDVYLKRTA